MALCSAHDTVVGSHENMAFRIVVEQGEAVYVFFVFSQGAYHEIPQ